MADHLGVQNNNLSAPSGAEINTSSKTRRLANGIATGRAEDGTTVYAYPKKIVETVETITGIGNASFASVTAGAHVASTLKIHRASQDEQAEELARFEQEATAFSTLSTPTTIGANDVTVTVNLDDIGIQSMTLSEVNSVRVEKSTERAGPIPTRTGGFKSAYEYDAKSTISIDGSGDLPTELDDLGGAGTATIGGCTTGKTIITEITESEDSENENNWSVSAENFPSANTPA